MGSATVGFVLLAVPAVLAGCGGSSDHAGHNATVAAAVSPDGSYAGRSAEQVLAASTVAVKQARSVRISGTIDQAGHTLRYSMTEVPGKGTAGTVTVDGASAQVRHIGTAVYAKPTKKFLTGQAGAAGATLYATLRGRWLKADEQIAAAAGLGNLGDLGTLASTFDKVVPTNGSLTRVAGTTVSGAKTTGVTFSTGGKKGTVYVSTTAPGYPLRVRSSAGTVTFSHWDEKVSVTKPGQVLDIADLDVGSLGLGSAG
jgi:hypothetical protein